MDTPNPVPPLPTVGNEKPCEQCNVVKTLDKFRKLRGSIDGREQTCKECKEATWKENRKKSETIKASRDRLKEVRTAWAQGQCLPEDSDLLEAIIHEFGGVEALAKEFVKDHFASEPGTSTVKRSFEAVFRMAERHTARMAQKRDIYSLSEDELLDMARELMEDVDNGVKLYQGNKKKRA